MNSSCNDYDTARRRLGSQLGRWSAWSWPSSLGGPGLVWYSSQRRRCGSASGSGGGDDHQASLPLHSAAIDRATVVSFELSARAAQFLNSCLSIPPRSSREYEPAKNRSVRVLTSSGPSACSAANRIRLREYCNFDWRNNCLLSSCVMLWMCKFYTINSQFNYAS